MPKIFQNKEKLVFHFVGDIGLNNTFCDPRNHDALKCNMAQLAEIFGDCDLRVGNWEAPLWGDGHVNLEKNPRIYTTVETANRILPLRLNVALLANNHVYDCLEKGFENTLRFFETNNIRYLGAGLSQVEARQPLILIIKGIKTALLNYVAPDTHPNISQESKVFLNILDYDRMLQEIKDLKSNSDIVIVNLHWGMELLQYPSSEQRTVARKAVEAGARIVACHHPHCLQGHETWENGHIFYSLGNFLFGGLSEWKKQEWPKFCSDTVLATCVVSKQKCEHIYTTYLKQKKTFLEIDRNCRREKKQNRLNRKLALDNRKYKNMYRRSLFFRKVVILPWFMIDVVYGLVGTLTKIRRIIAKTILS